MQKSSFFRGLLMAGMAVCVLGLAAPAQADIFLQRSKEGAQGDGGAAPIFLNRNPTSGAQSGGSGIYITRDDNKVKAMTPEERRARAQQNYNTKTEAQSGQTYSIEEYNRRLIAQRQKAAAGNARSNNKSGSAYDSLARSGYGVATNDRYVVDPGTGRMMKESELAEIEKKREEYLKNNRFASARERSPSEESFFMKNGYYPDDADQPAGDSGIRNSFGTKLDYTPPTRRDKYGTLANRYRNFTGSSDR